LLTGVGANQLLVVEEAARTQGAGIGKWWLAVLGILAISGLFMVLRRNNMKQAG